MKKIKVTAVSYLNTKPLLYGLFKSKLAPMLDLKLDIPAVCAARLRDGDAQLGLVPVAILPELQKPRIISDFCIGANGAVQTVSIYSRVPLEQVERIYLDYHSRTSVELTRILLREYWQLSPELVPADTGYETRIQGKDAGLIIGDRAIAMAGDYPYDYDLAEAWLDHTGLPFVFAAWVSTRPLDPEFLHEFNEALKMGIAAIPELIYLLPTPASGFDLEKYYTRHISYALDEPKKQALNLFLNKIAPGKKSPLSFDAPALSLP
jgi:chorismate dehydratase